MTALMAALPQAFAAFLWQGCVLGAGVAVLRWAAPDMAWRYRVTFWGLLAAPIWVMWTLIDLLSGDGSSLAAAPVWARPVAIGWAVGTGALGVRLLGGWWRLQMLRRRCVPLASAAQHRLAALGARMGVRRLTTLVEADWASGPLTIGWLRPLVVVPLGFLTAMPPSWVDALLAHELAHIARRDYLHALTQRLIEALLFFHPVVWWLSHALNQQRELCCDDQVVHRLADRRAYLSGLARLAEHQAASALTPAAHGGALMHRIRRLARPAPRPSRTARPVLALLCLVGLCLPAFADAPTPTGVQWLPAEVQVHAATFEAAGKAHGIDPRLLAIMTYVESRGAPNAVSPHGSRGLMQLMPATARSIAAARGLTFDPKAIEDPSTNVDFGAWYLKQQIAHFKDIDVAVAAYNGGPKHVAGWLAGKAPLRAETRKYMEFVNALWSERDAPTSKTLAARRARRP